MSHIFVSAENLQAPDRRVHVRQSVLFSCIQLGDGNGGTLLNISERGLALRAVRSLSEKRLRRIRFQFSRSQAWIETQGKIAWTSASDHTAGLEFVDLQDEARNRIRRWISLVSDSNKSAAPQAACGARATSFGPMSTHCTGGVCTAAEHAGGIAIEAVMDSGRADRSDATIANSRPRKRNLRVIASVLCAVVFLSAFIAFGHHLQGRLRAGHSQAVAAAAGATQLPSDAGTKRERSRDGVQALGDTDLALQVGAMIYKGHAESLAKSLLQKGFPAFVFSRNGDRFYRVVVSPFRSVTSAAAEKEQLRKKGFESIVVRLNSAAEQARDF